MVKVTNVVSGDNYVDVTYEVNGLTDPISCRVYHADILSPQEIASNGWHELRPHIEMQLEQQVNDVPWVTEDPVVAITLLGTENMNFTEGQAPVEKSFRCAGKTLYGKTVDLRDTATFTPSREISINPISSCEYTVSASYNDLSDTKSFFVTFTSLQEIADREAADQAAREAAAQAEADRLAQEEANKLPPLEDYLIDLDYRLSMVELGL
jgi:hypothetical protein